MTVVLGIAISGNNVLIKPYNRHNTKHSKAIKAAMASQ